MWKWAVTRLTLGADDGLSFRQNCWRVDGGVAVLSERVLKDAHARRSTCHDIAEIIGFRNLQRLADQIIGPEVDRKVIRARRRVPTHLP